MICACCCEKPKGAIGSDRAAIFDSRTLQSTLRSVATMRIMMEPRDARAVKCMQPSIRLPNLLSLLVTPANEQDRAQGGELAQAVQEATGQSVEIAFVDAGYTGDAPAEAAKEHGIRLEVVKLPEAKRAFVLLPRRWVVERSFAWTTRFRRLVRDYERLPATLAGLHLIVFACLMLHHWMAFSGPTSRHVHEQETPVRR